MLWGFSTVSVLYDGLVSSSVAIDCIMNFGSKNFKAMLVGLT